MHVHERVIVHVHVHLLGLGFKVLIEVATLKTKGRADAKTVAEALAWIIENRNYIMQVWLERGGQFCRTVC